MIVSLPAAPKAGQPVEAAPGRRERSAEALPAAAGADGQAMGDQAADSHTLDGQATDGFAGDSHTRDGHATDGQEAYRGNSRDTNASLAEGDRGASGPG